MADSNTPNEITPVKEIPELEKLNPRQQLFVSYFLDKNNKATFGHRTNSYIKAYGLDPEKDYAVACAAASRLLRNVNSLASQFLESKGVSMGFMLEVLVQKVATSDNPVWWDKAAYFLGIDPGVIEQKGSITNTQINVYNFSTPEAKEYNEKMRKMLEEL